MAQRDSILTPSAAYQDPLAAIAWLERVFGFEIAMLLTDDNGGVAHAEMAFRGAHIGVMREWSSPALLRSCKSQQINPMAIAPTACSIARVMSGISGRASTPFPMKSSNG